ncbi:MAG: hypothetical protein ABJN42_21820 [Roseibium sp.]|uniref:hypothetical protein n=1 Tax=Alphaproteobacteria TaxID=28211 RepID=UPI0032994467
MTLPLPELFHGSDRLHDIGTTLKGRGQVYEDVWQGADFYAALEAHRPADVLAHRDAVFMCGWDDLDLCGGSLDVVLKVKPIGAVTRHDMNWSSEISCLIGDGFDITSPEVTAAAEKYWHGIPGGDPVWEYIAPQMCVLEVCENNLEAENKNTEVIDDTPEP